MSIKLRQENLEYLPFDIIGPNYDRKKLNSSIVHIGVGGFHRAHQAYYTDELLSIKDRSDWAICGIGLRKEDKRLFNNLRDQDFLYTLVVKYPNGDSRERVIGSITEFIYSPDKVESAICKMADPHTKIVTLTITEGGYNYNQTSGEFMLETPDIQWDIKNPGRPRTVFGYFVESLKIRKRDNIPPFTIMSCDNIQHNGDVTMKMLLSFADQIDPELSDWIRENVSFPNSMVDRITPVTTDIDRKSLFSKTGIIDNCPVVCEPYIQWVVEDKFTCGRPGWEDVGVQFVNNIEPYEKMKIRMLNAGHSLLGFTGSLCGYNTVDEAVKDPVLIEYLQGFLDTEVISNLGMVEGINLTDYKDSIIQRFENPNLKDQLSRICGQSSNKIPKFVLPTIREQLNKNASIKYGTLVIASWCRILELYDSDNFSLELQDDMFDILYESAMKSMSGDAQEFLRIKEIFGDLVDSKRFVDTYARIITGLRKYGVKDVLNSLRDGV